ncbi:hypothetical protein HMPREF1314_2291 [Bifidobacterium longum subsp. longum 35B]|nr:hypothetical protein HMPREF1314_2291 [Bifidobacterium longum subsp. longum 35B]
MRDHAFAFGIEDLHLQGPQADDHLMAGVFGSGRVPVAALDGDVSVCFASMFVRQVRQCFSVVWADGFPRCRHRFPVM